MLLKRELEDIARLNRLKPYQQEKNYVQMIILNSIYSVSADEIIFKGGTALFFVYGLNRFSEDLDFTLAKKIDVEKIIGAIKRNFELLGMKNKIDKLNNGEVSLSFRVSVEGPLFAREIERCFVNVEVSKREEAVNFNVNEIKPIYSDLMPFSLAVMAEKEIASEKIRAILTRNYARDVYDLQFLLKKGTKLNINLINKKLSYYNKQFNKKEFMRKLNEKKDIWESELRPFIIGNLPDFASAKKLIVASLKELE
jgi:predicted nucleotidyltransferase component of viral defense system